MIADSDWWVRTRAADALGKIGGPKVVDAVLALIKDENQDIRRAAIEILNQTKDERAVAQLIEATKDRDWWVSERAVDALAEIGSDEGAACAFIEMLHGRAEITADGGARDRQGRRSEEHRAPAADAAARRERDQGRSHRGALQARR